MAQLKTPIDVLNLLPKTNCRECGAATCLVFAVAVLKGEKRLGDCPHLEAGVVEEYDPKTEDQPSVEQEREEALEDMRRRVAAIDFSSAAAKLGARLEGEKLIVKCLGKDFAVDSKGVIVSDCHMNPWVAGPLLNYVAASAGKEVKGEWIPFRDLKGGEDWGRFFSHRCEKPLKKVIDDYTGLFEYIIDVFDGRPAPDSFDSDIAVVIHPLPKLPILICYWKEEDGMASALNLFFDLTAADNLNIESIYVLGVGLLTMFQKITQTHGR